MTEERAYEEIREQVMLSVKDIDYMKHALGIDRLIKKKKYKPYRNYFAAGKSDEYVWEYLVACELAFETEPSYYHVSNYGKRILSEILDIEIEID